MAPVNAEQTSKPWDEDPARWLVTGGAGFIGSHLVESLLARGQHVTVLDDFSSGHERNVERATQAAGNEAKARLVVVRGDIRSFSDVDEATRGVDYVLHHAARGSVPQSLEQPALYHAVNVDGTFNVYEAARHAGVRAVVVASSAAVYGDDERQPKVEANIGVPLSPYALGKRIAEQYGELLASVYAFPVVALRYFNVVGPRQDPAGAYAAVVPRWLQCLARGQAPTIYGDGETSRDFCPVSQIVEANLLAAARADQLRGRVFNVGLGRRTSLNELMAILRDGMAQRGAPCAELQPRYEDFRAGDIRHSHADISRARAELGFAPNTDVAEGLAPAMDAAMDPTVDPTVDPATTEV